MGGSFFWEAEGMGGGRGAIGGRGTGKSLVEEPEPAAEVAAAMRACMRASGVREPTPRETSRSKMCLGRGGMSGAFIEGVSEDEEDASDPIAPTATRLGATGGMR